MGISRGVWMVAVRSALSALCLAGCASDDDVGADDDDSEGPTPTASCQGQPQEDEVFAPYACDGYQSLIILEMNGDLLDSSGGGRDAEALDTATFEDTAFGQGLRTTLDAADGLSLSAFADALTHPFTVELVIIPDDTDGYAKLFSFDDDEDDGWYYGGQSFQAYPGPELGADQLLPGERHYLALVSTSDTRMSVYFQGNLLGDTAMGFTAPPAEAIFFEDDRFTDRDERLAGVVEALRIGRGALPAGQRAAVVARLAGRAVE